MADRSEDALIDRIYDSALRPEAWAGTLAAIADHLSSDKAVLYTFRHPPDQGGFAVTYNLPQSGPEAWARISHLEDPHALALARVGASDGSTYEGTELVPVKELHASRLYRDIWRFHGMEHMAAGLIFLGTDGRKLPTCISLFRPASQPNFSAEEVAVVRRLVAHLSRSMGVMYHLRDADRRLAASRAALDGLRAGVVLLDGERRIVHANPAAEAIFRDGRTVAARTAGGVRSLVLPEATGHLAEALERAITGALDLRRGNPDHFSDGLVLQDAEGRPLSVVHVAPIAAGHLASSDSTVRGIVFLYPLRSAEGHAPPLFKQIFGLTAAEARVVDTLLEGGTQAAIARRLSISPNTLKTQLASIYTKTNTHRHADLLKLLFTFS